MSLMRAPCALVIAFVSLGLIGCGGKTTVQTTSHATPNQIIRVRIVRTSPIPQSDPPIDKVILDDGAAQRLYDATVALPVFPAGPHNCPDDRGVRILLTFTRGSGQTVQVSEDPYGCQDVILEPHDVRKATDNYWSTLAQTLQITRAQLQPDWR